MSILCKHVFHDLIHFYFVNFSICIYIFMLFICECLCKWCVYFSAILQAIAFIDPSINKDFFYYYY